MLFYRAALPLSSKTLTFVSGVIRRHRAAIGSPWRKLNLWGSEIRFGWVTCAFPQQHGIVRLRRSTRG
jgi:hypothetical protein